MNSIDFQVLSEDDQAPLTLQQLKAYARISYSYDDELLKQLLKASVQYVERVTNLSLNQKRVLARITNPTQIANLRWAIKQIEEVECSENCNAAKLANIKDYIWHDNRIFFLTLSKFNSAALQLKITYSTLRDQPDAYLAYWIMHHTTLMYDKNPAVMQFEEQMKDFYQASGGIKL
ncbi:hypothetical protein Sarmat_00103 [Rickettsiales endosymbiont of Paramecium tredecaurelia]|uniref:head-tail connector protein n=1 Tax=Candidatus Sarmatiella mevalonica TaxID=2770581 RepID=UPI0019232AC3|nr:head-tail connector protein [Candidatus Sarmatiella mevalonica]MBL3284263.1 hypothetical protein [Candidatus Sarmatiella mevalonica]